MPSVLKETFEIIFIFFKSLILLPQECVFGACGINIRAPWTEASRTMWVKVARTIRTELWCVVTVCVVGMVLMEVAALNGPNVCMVKQK